MLYKQTFINENVWIVCEEGRDYQRPQQAYTFAFDTETLTYLDGKILNDRKLAAKLRKMDEAAKRRRVSVKVWAWQAYDEVNGFFMSNDFETFLQYLCACRLKFGWCYNSTFDFSQIDYQVLAAGRDKWKPRVKEKDKAYNKAQPWAYESLHSDMGARYAYKLWVPYRNVKDRHKYVHSVEFRDFMKLIPGGLRKLLEDLEITDNDGNPVRKLEMNYQAVNSSALTQEEIGYCCNDVKGLYFAVKKFNAAIEEQSNGELHIFGKKTNIMTAGGFAKRELLRSLYPDKMPQYRLQKFQREHPLAPKQDAWLRSKHLYRGGISFVNPRFKGFMLTAKKMHKRMCRFDVNSEYPYSMQQICDLVGAPIKKTFLEWESMADAERAKYECVYVMTSCYGRVRDGYLGLWYDPFKKEFVETIAEEGEHCIFERELNEMLNWYDDLEFTCDNVILWKKGGHAYAPFVEENYALKAKAKKEGNKTLQQCTKLKLNSSYGKLSERLERVKGHYELNDETGAIHFVADGVEESARTAMNVAVGALITAYARCYILSKIREICGDRPADNFVYIDTDSIHCFADYDKADAFALGGLKLEAKCDAVKYIAPKTYVDIEKVNEDGTIEFDAFEVHSKGVNIASFVNDLKKKQKGKKHGLPTLDLFNRKMAYGAKYPCLVAMNVQGGKALLPTDKYLARPELMADDYRQVVTNYAGVYFAEI